MDDDDRAMEEAKIRAGQLIVVSNSTIYRKCEWSQTQDQEIRMS